MKKKISIKKIIDTLHFEPLYECEVKDVVIASNYVNRPGLQLAGYFDYFSNDRIQLIGMSEVTYMQGLDPEVLDERLEWYLSQSIPCVICARNIIPVPEFVEKAKQHNIPILMSGMPTTRLMHDIVLFLDKELAPCISRHAGLMDVYGVGVYITGDSGVGKSETALELVKRGHRLVADDVVDIRKLSDGTLVGSSPDAIRHLMEIRGLGLIDVSVLYGMGSVRLACPIDMCIHLEPGDIANANRLGNLDDHITLLGRDIPKITIPVRPGRNIAIIIEVAAMNQRLKASGYDPMDRLNQKILNLIG